VVAGRWLLLVEKGLLSRVIVTHIAVIQFQIPEKSTAAHRVGMLHNVLQYPSLATVLPARLVVNRYNFFHQLRFFYGIFVGHLKKIL
jgi:hypothetical protein